MVNLAGKRVLVTGGAGFIGSHLVDSLIEKGCEVVVLDNFDDFYSGKERNLARHIGNERFRLVRGDILNYELLLHVMKGVEVVFHEAAQAGIRYCNLNPVKAHRVNVEGTLNVLLACKERGVKRIVYASSSSIFGKTGFIPINEACPTNPSSPYGATKLAGEKYCLSFHEAYGIDVVCLRYFSVYGPRGRPDQVIYSMAYRMLTGNRPIVYGSGEQRRDFTYVSDIVEATLLAAETEGIAGEVFNIGFGKDFSINELLKILVNTMSIDEVEPEYLESYRGDFERTLADNSKAQRILGWRPRVSLEEGVRRFVEWLGDTLKCEERV
ncbi:MAG: NAD-dependent epimerase/dehydratase family protein [Candidatus Brockarchaeota archaeon]|nr:NAD-dependent epimerase/dehydratase family protein [Candidatus Brockarchaeota archaeon]